MKTGKKIIIGLVGKICSGKGTAAKYLAEKHLASCYKFSTILRDILRRLHLEISRNNLSLTYKILTEGYGADILSRVLLNEIENDKNKIIVFDGVRAMADFNSLSALKNFTLVDITADDKIRYRRLIARNENKGDLKKTYRQFIEDQNCDPDSSISLILARAKVIITNNNLPRDLFKQLDQIVEVINHKYDK